MKLTVVWIARDSAKENKKTEKCLARECAACSDEVQLLLYGAPKKRKPGARFGERTKLSRMDGFADKSELEVVQDAVQHAEGEYITVLGSGDTFSEGALNAALSKAERAGKPAVVMMKKIMPDGMPGAFSADEGITAARSINLRYRYNIFPFYLGGTLIRTDILRSQEFHPELEDDADRKLLLDICASAGRLFYIPEISYNSGIEREGDVFLFRGIFHPDFYEKSLREFWLPYLAELREKYGRIPMFIQYHAVFSILCRIKSNLNNRNKHVIPEGREEDVLHLIGVVFQELDDGAIFNAYSIDECRVGTDLKWVLGILKYGEDYRFRRMYAGGSLQIAAGPVILGKINNLTTNILFMDYVDGRLEIDGTVHGVLYSVADEVVFHFKGRNYPLNYNDRYALTKIFGVSVCKEHSFHVTIPLGYCTGNVLECQAIIRNEMIRVQFSYQSHFSRMSGRFENSYWWFGPENDRYIMTKDNGAMVLRSAEQKDQKAQEKLLQKEMFSVGRQFDRRSLLFILIRKAFFFYKKLKKRPIWMYLDKIYKGGDSSEYLYRYASAQKDDIKHYYLIDKNSADYARLKKDGFKPLVRGSIRHRLVFMSADMMIISNSTVYAFNNFGMINSSYIRDLPDFHVCCVQHGMSVQKIAVAQNRLRDNTRLYFCASKYELQNLQRPIYDYVGYGALRLTGVPRYDGLINEDKKQILISPTWRMQAAAPVRTSEGEQRDYNPLFKKSPYFKVYNSLINDERLIAAAKKYGYRIKYILHPIVSAQLKDFDRNDYVDIIPAVGDMSYEKMFRESSLMVTDFSGVQFDFAYMRKPVVYLHHRDIPEHYEEGSFFYDSMGFGEICHDNDELIDLLMEYMADGCRMKEEYVRRADDFFYYSDHNNCERIYREMIAYQKEHILGQKNWEVLQGEISLGNRHRDVMAAERLLAEKGASAQPYSTNDAFFDLAVREGTILMLGLGHSVRGNMMYILKELNRDPFFTGYRIYVRTSEDTEYIVNEYIRKNHWNRTRTVSDSKQYRDLMETAQYLITEVFFPDNWVKHEGQTVINIWHGTPLKKLGLAKNSRNLHHMGNTQRNFIDTDYLIYPNEYTRRNMLDSYKVEDLLTGRTGLIGYARTGGMLQAGEEAEEQIREQLAPNGEKIYAYMPTWRDYLSEDQLIEDTRTFLQEMDNGLTDHQILYVNLHHKVSDVLDYSSYRHIRKFPAFIDTYQLLAATDALITDYSSVFYDYLATRKQIVLVCADYEEYEKKRGTYMNLMDLPFDKVSNGKEAVAALNRGKTYDDTEVYQTFCANDSPSNARRLCALMKGRFAPQADRAELTVPPQDGRRKVIIDTEKFEDSGMSRALLDYLRGQKDEKSHVWISCDPHEVDKNKDVAYPALFSVPVIGTQTEMHLTGRGKTLRRLYLEGKVDFGRAMEYLRYDYALECCRSFGHARFDAVVLYDSYTPQRLIMLSHLNGEKYLVVTKTMMQKVREEEGREMADAIRYTASRCTRLYAEDEEVQSFLSQTFPEISRPALFEGSETLRRIVSEN